MHRISRHRKRRCPNCSSDKWERLETVPTTPEELELYLLVHYRCRRCSTEFLVEEAKGSKYVSNPSQCVHCGSERVEKISKEDADLELWICRQCNGFMGVQEPNLDNSADPEAYKS